MRSGGGEGGFRSNNAFGDESGVDKAEVDAVADRRGSTTMEPSLLAVRGIGLRNGGFFWGGVKKGKGKVCYEDSVLVGKRKVVYLLNVYIRMNLWPALQDH